MKPLVSSAIEEYVNDLSSPVPPLLEELERETHKEMEHPEMIVGRVEGRLLQMLVRISGASSVVEIGTFTGYSALMMAEALPDNGRLITCEISEECARMARRYFSKTPLGKKITLNVGPALSTLRQLPDGTVDFIFIDADKTSYPDYYQESRRLLRIGGIIAADNVLWSGTVVHPGDEDSRAIHSFNRMVRRDPSVETVLLTVRDGVSLIRKIR